MKLSEAILLGSTVVTPKAGGQYFAENQAGCALGMAAIARGCSFRRVIWPFPLEGPPDPRHGRRLGRLGAAYRNASLLLLAFPRTA
jgi:hypothetical protein